MRRRAARRGSAVFVAALVVVSACSHGSSVEFETRARLTPKLAAAAAPTTVPSEVGGLLGGNGASAAQGSTGGGSGRGTAVGPPIKIGIVLPLQGGQRAFGEPVLRATQAYIEELNSVGGVNGSPLPSVAATSSTPRPA